MPKTPMTLQCSDLTELPGLVKQIVQHAGDKKIWLFDGDMGAGKTTIIKAICDEFGVEDNVSSPTFSIINEYRNHNDDIFYHFDFYRFEKESEALNIGVQEYFDSGEYCFLEWPEKASSYLPQEYFEVKIAVENKQLRIIQLNHYDGGSI